MSHANRRNVVSRRRLVGALGLGGVLALGAAGWSAGQPEFDAEDEAAVRGAILDYVGSYYETQPERLESAVHGNLKKRNVRSMPDGTQYLNEMTKSQLIAFAAVANRGGQWTESSRKEVTVYGIEHGIASARLEADSWIDYFHLAEINGEWSIVNVLWASLPEDEG